MFDRGNAVAEDRVTSHALWLHTLSECIVSDCALRAPFRSEMHVHADYNTVQRRIQAIWFIFVEISCYPDAAASRSENCTRRFTSSDDDHTD